MENSSLSMGFMVIGICHKLIRIVLLFMTYVNNLTKKYLGDEK